MKTCSSCKSEKESEMFQKRKASHDGLTSRCKSCLKEYEDSRLRDPKRMMARREYQKTSKGKISHNKASKKWVEKNAIKRGCHIIVGNALRDKRLFKSTCEVCGSKKVEGHHDDYSRPLSVRWLCAEHHNQWHKENGEAKNAE